MSEGKNTPGPVRKLCELPLGALFRYPGKPAGSPTFVLLDKGGCGAVATAPDLDEAPPVLQGVYSAAESPEAFREMLVSVQCVNARDELVKTAVMVRDVLATVVTSETFHRDPRGDNVGPALDALDAAIAKFAPAGEGGKT